MKQQVTQVALGVIAVMSFSAVAGPKPAVIEVVPKVEVTAPPVKVEGIQPGGQLTTLEGFKQSLTPVNPAVNQGALETLNQQEAVGETCGAGYVANKVTARVPKLKGQEAYLAKAVQDGLLRAGCGEGGLLGVENDRVIENVAETVICQEMAGGTTLGAALDSVGGSCLLDAKKNDPDSPVAAMDPETAKAQALEDYLAVRKCWFQQGNTTVN